MDVDEPKGKSKGMSILGASKWAKQQDSAAKEKDANEDGDANDDDAPSRMDLDKKENELREKMLRQKVLKTRRKSSTSEQPSTDDAHDRD